MPAEPSQPDASVAITLDHVHKWFGTFHVLNDINLAVHKGERIVVCGPSGSGKSTMIRCINALEQHQQGHIVVNGVELTNDVRTVDRIRRNVGMVFQQFNLFPHLTVLDNLTLAPIWVQKQPKAAAVKTAMEYLERVHIPEQAAKYPGQLSGGQQQRVAIARALCMKPEIMLSPLSQNFGSDASRPKGARRSLWCFEPPAFSISKYLSWNAGSPSS